MARSNKILQVLEEADRTAFEEHLRAHPATTLDEGVAWLAEKGYTLSRKAVWTYKRNFQETLDGVRRSAELARSFTQVAREGNSVADLSEASLGRFNQLMMEKLFQLESEGELDSGELMKLSIALKGSIDAKRVIEKLKAESEKRQKAAVEEAAKVAEAGGGVDAVLGKVREILGVK